MTKEQIEKAEKLINEQAFVWAESAVQFLLDQGYKIIPPEEEPIDPVK